MKDFRELRMKCSIDVGRVLEDTKGQTMVEYALLLVLIALLVFIMLKGTGLQVNSAFSTVNSQLASP